VWVFVSRFVSFSFFFVLWFFGAGGVVRSFVLWIFGSVRPFRGGVSRSGGVSGVCLGICSSAGRLRRKAKKGKKEGRADA